MKPLQQAHAQGSVQDPRCRSDFQPQYFPKANGQEAPPIQAASRQSLFSPGSTGDSPVPSGDPPDGTGAISNAEKLVFSHPDVSGIPPSESPALPSLNSYSRHDGILLEFLAVYYELNCEYARLLEVRTEPESTRRQENERARMLAVEKWLIARDALEDRYAPFGAIAEPDVREGFTVNVRIRFGNV